MFRKFRESPYFRAGLTVLVCGGILIMFHNWVTNTHFSVGFETLTKTVAPIIIGGIFAFILCPVYNACVKAGYRKMIKGAQRKGFSIGALIIHDEGVLEVDKDEKRRILTAARAFASLVCVILVVGLVGLFVYFVVPQVVESAINLINTMPQRLDALSDWCAVNLSHFPMIATWVDNIANAGNNIAENNIFLPMYQYGKNLFVFDTHFCSFIGMKMDMKMSNDTTCC
jgi:predicted PurR-regulated permease PerM